MNTVRTTARLEHSPPFAASCAFGTRNPLRRQRVIGGEGASARLENFGGCVTGKNCLCRVFRLGAAGLGFQKGVLLTDTGSRSRDRHFTGQGRQPADFSFRAPDLPLMTGREDYGPANGSGFSFCDELGRVRQNLPKQVANQSHRASVASFVVIAIHHRRQTGCRPIQTTQEPVS